MTEEADLMPPDDEPRMEWRTLFRFDPPLSGFEKAAIACWLTVAAIGGYVYGKLVIFP